VFYRYYDENTVIISIVSKDYVYTNRTVVVMWLIILDAIIMTSLLLSVRHYNSRTKTSDISTEK
jgi:hypothetical protein